MLERKPDIVDSEEQSRLLAVLRSTPDAANDRPVAVSAPSAPERSASMPYGLSMGLLAIFMGLLGVLGLMFGSVSIP
ncbi:MAG TPA: ABC transporter permease, partial [Pelagibacterium sp.]|nr:ABC transporter permease [Pelagibacterium sp.]